ncbi:MAG: hypothetical protein JO023_09955 [Chloroflexi bacterium]|nr:hypothetical protein [Chloroflexota bacterium]
MTSAPVADVRREPEPVSPDRSPDRDRLVDTVLWGATAGVVIVYAVVFVLSAAARIPSPYELMYGESIVLQESRRFAMGDPLYPAPTQLPLTVTAYTPLYYVLVGTLQRFFADYTYTIGRLVSLGSTLGGALCLAFAIRRAGGRWSAGGLAAVYFLTQNMTALLWAPLDRVDPLALGLTLLGLALAADRRPLWATLPFLLAMLTKQSYVVAPLAVFVVLWPARRTMLAFALILVVGLIAAVLACQRLTDGWFLWHVVVANANPFTFDYVTTQLGGFLQFNGLPLLLASAMFALPGRPGERLWRVYFVLTLLETLATIGKVGASSNYWLELSAATAGLIGLLAVRVLYLPGRASSWYVRALLGGLLIAMPAYQATAYEGLLLTQTGETPGLHDQAQLTQLVAQTPGDVFTDEPGIAIAAGKSIQFEAVIYTVLAEQHLWDQTPILDAIHAKRFSLVVLDESLDDEPPPIEAERITRTVRDALHDAYEPIGQQNGVWLYRPRS